jgi:transposase-like protein
VASNELNENEIKRLKKQVLRLTQERDILKKAVLNSVSTSIASIMQGHARSQCE